MHMAFFGFARWLRRGVARIDCVAGIFDSTLHLLLSSAVRIILSDCTYRRFLASRKFELSKDSRFRTRARMTFV
ncbi:uncharacterized protein EDB91DRAFT_1113829 [Suillus paluster]|uniref:uncharacterized protein n=1 Tax=Suillus paluster TaxID=48578 RepID=UPI001B87B3DA|nr:uncharacterized protein EDB91DRAFT_1113829 [Suillus paluster]KAG1748405.1 hypothetical protein EDB91DRAFT_1113829 [Suillus paluster]